MKIVVVCIRILSNPTTSHEISHALLVCLYDIIKHEPRIVTLVPMIGFKSWGENCLLSVNDSVSTLASNILEFVSTLKSLDISNREVVVSYLLALVPRLKNHVPIQHVTINNQVRHDPSPSSCLVKYFELARNLTETREQKIAWRAYLPALYDLAIFIDNQGWECDSDKCSLFILLAHLVSMPEGPLLMRAIPEMIKFFADDVVLDRLMYTYFCVRGVEKSIVYNRAIMTPFYRIILWTLTLPDSIAPKAVLTKHTNLEWALNNVVYQARDYTQPSEALLHIVRIMSHHSKWKERFLADLCKGQHGAVLNVLYACECMMLDAVPDSIMTLVHTKPNSQMIKCGLANGVMALLCGCLRNLVYSKDCVDGCASFFDTMSGIRMPNKPSPDEVRESRIRVGLTRNCLLFQYCLMSLLTDTVDTTVTPAIKAVYRDYANYWYIIQDQPVPRTNDEILENWAGKVIRSTSRHDLDTAGRALCAVLYNPMFTIKTKLNACLCMLMLVELSPSAAHEIVEASLDIRARKRDKKQPPPSVLECSGKLFTLMGLSHVSAERAVYEELTNKQIDISSKTCLENDLEEIDPGGSIRRLMPVSIIYQTLGRVCLKAINSPKPLDSKRYAASVLKLSVKLAYECVVLVQVCTVVSDLI